jgi:hypothetical protein
VTVLGLPDRVAAHFGAGGVANGFMPRNAYLFFMLVIVVGLPLLVVLLTWVSLNRPGARINLPNREYWLAPQRRAQSIAWIRAGVLQFGALLIIFLCYAQWLVARANRHQPSQLDESWFYGGLAAFLVAVLLWARSFLRRFRSPVRDGSTG